MAFDQAEAERSAVWEADGLGFFCDAGIVGLANTMLGTLAGFATIYPDWRRTLETTVGREGAAEAAARVETARLRFGLDDPIGAVPHGTRFFGEIIADQRQHRRAIAVRLLVVTGRLVEAAGAGARGLVILSAEHLDAGRLGLAAAPVRFDR